MQPNSASHSHKGLLAFNQQLIEQALDLVAAHDGPGLAGVAGEHHFGVDSSLGRELAFVASHTVHHFALLAPYCQQHAISTGAHFGQAPSTVRHHQLMRTATCTPSSAAAH